MAGECDCWLGLSDLTVYPRVQSAWAAGDAGSACKGVSGVRAAGAAVSARPGRRRPGPAAAATICTRGKGRSAAADGGGGHGAAYIKVMNFVVGAHHSFI